MPRRTAYREPELLGRDEAAWGCSEFVTRPLFVHCGADMLETVGPVLCIEGVLIPAARIRVCSGPVAGLGNFGGYEFSRCPSGSTSRKNERRQATSA